jgi:hypothetical protein
LCFFIAVVRRGSFLAAHLHISHAKERSFAGDLASPDRLAPYIAMVTIIPFMPDSPRQDVVRLPRQRGGTGPMAIAFSGMPFEAGPQESDYARRPHHCPSVSGNPLTDRIGQE